MFKKLNIATKLNLIVSVTIMIVIGFLGYINIILAEKQIINTLVRASQRIARAIVDDLETYMFRREIDNMQSTMDIFVAEQPNIKKLMLINKDGRVTLSTEKKESGAVLSKQSHACKMCHMGNKPIVNVSNKNLSKVVVPDHGERFLTVVNPIYNRKACYTAPCHVHPKSVNILGVIKTDFSLKEVNQTILQRRLEIIVTVVVAIMVISIVIGLFIRSYVSRPIDTLIKGMTRAGGGDLEARIRIENQDEIGQLADGFNQMITALFQSTSELRKTRDYLLGIVENSVDIIITVNPQGYIETFNRGAEQILGYDRYEVIGKRIEMLFARPEERDVAIRQLQDRDNVVNYETQFLRKDKTAVDVILTLSRLRDPKGNPIGTFGISKDVTEYHKLQKQLIQSECLAAIGETIASIIHSIKNILNSLKGGSYMIKTGLTKNNLELVQEGWDVTQDGIGKITELAMDMLDYTRTHKSSPELSSINDIVSEVCWSMAKTSDVQDFVNLTWDLDEAIPPIMVDRKAIYNAVLNLVSNAIDACSEREYVPGDHAWVRVRTYLEKNNNRVCIEVKDNGGGMSDEIKNRIFNPFFTTKFHKGTGLGLPITMKIIREHDGTLLLDTIPGQGSMFTMVLPYS
ncbi:MAG: ATP-binding protein [Pseudomonadota bacterium]